jgi:hypothetical protein
MNKKVLGIENLESRTLLSVAPNDTFLNNQWGLNNISSFGAWSQNTGSKSVVVAIIDSGIDLTHKDLKDNLWINPGEIPNDGIDNEGDGYIDDVNGWNFANNNNDVQDRYGHGTHIAGIIGAVGNNSLGVAGVNWNVSLMPLKFLDDKGVGDTGGALAAMDYILMMKNSYHINIVVANASWGGGIGFSNMLYGEIQKLNDANILLSVAAGNNGSDNDITLRYPSCFDIPNIISVGALGYDGIHLASYSNYGAVQVDLAAPGGMIYSTLPWNSYGYLSGTSMAAPFVAGTVALLNAVKSNLSVAEVKNAIFAGVDKIPELFGKVATNGKLNVEAAVDSLLGIPYEHNKAPIGSINYQSLRLVGGWAKDPDSLVSVNVQLWIDNNLVGSKITNSDGGFVFNLGGLTVGDHIINIKAQDVQSKSWTDIASTKVTIKPPVVHVGFLSINRVVGWAYSERSGSSPVVVRILVNNRLVASQWANGYRPALQASLGSSYHGFNISLDRIWFHRGSNNIKIQVYDPISKQVSIAWTGTTYK